MRQWRRAGRVPTTRAAQPGVARRGRRRARDRHGRGLRGPLAPPSVPVVRSRAQRFDDAVLSALERLERRWSAELADVQVYVEEVPPLDPATATGLDETGRPRLGRVEPAARRRPARLVVYRRPVEARLADRSDLDDAAYEVVVELVAELLGRSPDEVAPD